MRAVTRGAPADSHHDFHSYTKDCVGIWGPQGSLVYPKYGEDNMQAMPSSRAQGPHAVNPLPHFQGSVTPRAPSLLRATHPTTPPLSSPPFHLGSFRRPGMVSARRTRTPQEASQTPQQLPPTGVPTPTARGRARLQVPRSRHSGRVPGAGQQGQAPEARNGPGRRAPV